MSKIRGKNECQNVESTKNECEKWNRPKPNMRNRDKIERQDTEIQKRINHNRMSKIQKKQETSEKTH